MIKLQEIEQDLVEELREILDEFRHMNSYALTEQTTRIMSELKKALIATLDSVIEHDLEQFNNNWQELKYVLVDLENAIHEEQNENDRLGRKSPYLSKLNKSFMDVWTFQVWSIDRLTNQPTIS